MVSSLTQARYASKIAFSLIRHKIASFLKRVKKWLIRQLKSIRHLKSTVKGERTPLLPQHIDQANNADEPDRGDQTSNGVGPAQGNQAGNPGQLES